MTVLSIWKGVIHPPVTMRGIAADVAGRHGLTADDLMSKSRHSVVCYPRQEAMSEMRATGRFSYPQIARFFGGLHHTTVIHAVRAHARRRTAVNPLRIASE